MEIQDQIDTKITGELSFTVYDKDGNKVTEQTEGNLVVNMSKPILAHLLSGDTSKFITKLAIGTEITTPAPDDETIGTITTTNLILGNNVVGPDFKAYLKTLDGFTHPNSGEVLFEWSLDYAEANGMEICEFGLLTDDHHLFARKTRGSITKQADLAFEGTWKIIF